jgi:hypothetical protein
MTSDRARKRQIRARMAATGEPYTVAARAVDCRDAKLIFAEAADPDDGPFNGLADVLRRSGSTQARAARETINNWYGSFADRRGMVLSRLRSDKDAEILQAVDELYVHHLLSRSCQPRYEEDQTSPDFRLYRSSDYVAGVEIFTQFAEQSFSSEISRNAVLVDAINSRVRATSWYLSLTVRSWEHQPRVRDVTRWLENVIDDLPVPASDLTRENYPTATYSRPEVTLEFTFLPRCRTTAPTGGIVIGPVVAQFVKPGRRLRESLGQKSGGKYNHRDRPFAVLVSVRDFVCETEDIVNALYGDDAITYAIDQPGSARAIRKRNGLFGISSDRPAGRNRRLSCVFALMPGWTPGSNELPTIYRFDNPFAEQEFPDDLIVPHHRLVTRRDETSVRVEWE